MINADLESRHTPGASVVSTPNGFCLTIPEGGTSGYRVAQLDDYTKSPRRHFPHRTSLSLSLRARASADSIPGTWGFGLWNDPFGFSLGFGGNPFRIPALPNAVWFFHASQENYLSLTDPSTSSGRVKPGNGFMAQVFRSPVLPLGRFVVLPLGRFAVFPLGPLARVAATLPFSRKKARDLMGKIIEEDGVRLGADVTEWHAYRFEWSPKRSAFWVDEVLVLETSVSPRPPLGLVIWIDNQYAAFTPEGKIGFGILENDKPAWLEIEDIKLIGLMQNQTLTEDKRRCARIKKRSSLFTPALACGASVPGKSDFSA